MQKLFLVVFIFLLSITACVEAFALEQGKNGIERKIVARAEDVAIWMVSTSKRVGKIIGEQEAERAARVIVQLSRTREGREILTQSLELTDQLYKNGIVGQDVVEVAVKAAEALQNPKMAGFSIREIIILSPAVAIKEYPEAIGGEVMLRGSSVKLVDAIHIVNVLSDLIDKDQDAFNYHLADVKMKLINDWDVNPALADIAAQVVGTDDDKMEIVIPSRSGLLQDELKRKENFYKEAIKYLHCRGRFDDANKLELSMREQGAEFQLSHVSGKRGEGTIADPLEISIAVHFLETVHPDGAEFIRAMAEEERLGSMGLQQYIAMIKKEMSHEWVKVVNKNSLGHVALGDINKQMKKYENDLMKYAEFGGGKISITELASDYIQVGNTEMPYGLVSLMAEEPIYPEQLRIAFEAKIPSLEPIQIEAIDTLSGYLPSGIREVLDEIGEKVNLTFYEIEGMIRDLEVFRVRAASVSHLDETRDLLDRKKSFLIYVIMNKPKLVVWLSQVNNPIRGGDAKIVINEEFRKAIVEFLRVPVLMFDYAGRMDILVPEKNAIKLTRFDEEMAAKLDTKRVKPIYVGSTQIELAVLQEQAFMLPLYAELRKRKAAKYNIPSMHEIERASKILEGVVRSNHMNLEGIDPTVIPTRYEEIVIASVSSDDYEALQEQQRKDDRDAADGSEVYFFIEDGSFFKFEGESNLFGQRRKRTLDISELQQKLYQGHAVVFAQEDSLIDQPTAFEFFGNANHFKYRNGIVSFDDPYLTVPEKEKMLQFVDILDLEMGSLYGERQSGDEGSWKVLSCVRVTEEENNKATLVYISRGLWRDGDYVLEVSSDLARNPEKIKMRLRDMTKEDLIRERTVQDTSSLTTGILDSFETEEEETVRDKVVKWAVSKFRNRTEGGSLKGIRIRKLSPKKGLEYFDNQFPHRIEIGRLADISEAIVNVKGADKIRNILSEVIQ